MSLPHRPDILHAMRREAETSDRTLAPHRYVVTLAAADHDLLGSGAAGLARDLARAQAKFIKEQGWTVRADVLVEIERDTGLAAGAFRVSGDVATGSPADQAARANRAVPAARGVGLVLGDGRRYIVQAGATVIGRGRRSDLRLNDAGVSRRHARLDYDGSRVTLTDLGSTNGTTVNDRPVQEVALEPGDTIRVGSVTLTMQADA